MSLSELVKNSKRIEQQSQPQQKEEEHTTSLKSNIDTKMAKLIEKNPHFGAFASGAVNLVEGLVTQPGKTVRTLAGGIVDPAEKLLRTAVFGGLASTGIISKEKYDKIMEKEKANEYPTLSGTIAGEDSFGRAIKLGEDGSKRKVAGAALQVGADILLPKILTGGGSVVKKVAEAGVLGAGYGATNAMMSDEKNPDYLNEALSGAGAGAVLGGAGAGISKLTKRKGVVEQEVIPEEQKAGEIPQEQAKTPYQEWVKNNPEAIKEAQDLSEKAKTITNLGDKKLFLKNEKQKFDTKYISKWSKQDIIDDFETNKQNEKEKYTEEIDIATEEYLKTNPTKTRETAKQEVSEVIKTIKEGTLYGAEKEDVYVKLNEYKNNLEKELDELKSIREIKKEGLSLEKDNIGNINLGQIQRLINSMSDVGSFFKSPKIKRQIEDIGVALNHYSLDDTVEYLGNLIQKGKNIKNDGVLIKKLRASIKEVNASIKEITVKRALKQLKETTLSKRLKKEGYDTKTQKYEVKRFDDTDAKVLQLENERPNDFWDIAFGKRETTDSFFDMRVYKRAEEIAKNTNDVGMLNRLLASRKTTAVAQALAAAKDGGDFAYTKIIDRILEEKELKIKFKGEPVFKAVKERANKLREKAEITLKENIKVKATELDALFNDIMCK